MLTQRKKIIADPDKALAKLCERRFFRFFCEMWETIENVPLVVNWHIEEICDKLQDVYETWELGIDQDDVLINVPPGMSKSTIVTQLFPAWLWVKERSIRVISSSYAGDLATAHAVKTRDCLRSDKFNRLWPEHIEFKEDTDGKTHYKNKHMGERFVTSTGGRVTGMHGDFILIDDPLNPEEAASEADLKKANRFVSQTLSSRKTDKERTVTIMVMQRLHDADPAGSWISKGKSLNRICLPAELADNVYPVELASKYTLVKDEDTGELIGLLDTNRLGLKAIKNAKMDLGSYGYANQMMQRSAPEEGGIWRKNWLIPVPDNIFPAPETLDAYGSDWDTAYTEKEMNDASAYVVSGRTRNYHIYIDKIGYFRAEFPELIDRMQLIPGPYYIEAKASGKSAKQGLKKGGLAAIEVEVVGGDKIARTRTATPVAEAGLVFVRASILEKLLHDQEQGILNFPNAKHDDLNDAFVQAIQRHTKPRINLMASRKTQPTQNSAA